jgi:hypothetical protein
MQITAFEDSDEHAGFGSGNHRGKEGTPMKPIAKHHKKAVRHERAVRHVKPHAKRAARPKPAVAPEKAVEAAAEEQPLFVAPFFEAFEVEVQPQVVEVVEFEDWQF